MDSFEYTKIAGAVLSALLLIFATKTLIESRTGHAPETPGYTLPGGEPPKAEAAKGSETKAAEAKPADEKPATDAKPAEGAAPAKEAAAAPAAAGGGAGITALLAKASADNGKAAFSKCKTCHTIEKGKPKGVGPNLWGVVNRAKASAEGFEYSAALKAKGGNWTFEDLAAFIHKPAAFAAGTKMVFNGIPGESDVADLIAYLAAQSDTPVSLPK